MDLVIKFTEHSRNPSNYGKLHANLRTPFTQYATLIIDSLTTNACIEVLNSSDYIVFNDLNDHITTIMFNDSYTSLNANTVSTLLNDLLSAANSTIRTIVDNTNRIVFINDSVFQIQECSYNVKSVFGLYDQQLPINASPCTIPGSNEVVNGSSVYAVQCLSVGNYLSTPILYLLASIGEKCFINDNANRKILMRINNSYSANFPVIANNAEFSTYALSNDFSDITFELVDAEFRPVKLLSPMYLCGTITGDIKAETINTSILLTPEMMSKNINVNDDSNANA